MILIIILAIILIILIIRYIKTNNHKTESFKANQVEPNTSSIHQDDIAIHELYDRNCQLDECERIDKFNNQFFGFRDRTFNSSHQDDPVDNINITGKGQDYKIGSTIADVYDDLVNSYDYKTRMNKKCKN
jgi:FtsZ-interacting cell division protein ZipA